jgi:glycerophosphoryl diester phosphodiesterase
LEDYLKVSSRLPLRVIAHRGASGYLPEHTLAAKALAYAMGADFLEQDVVATRDDRLVVLHDVHIDRVTDVATSYPDRARDDGRYYARDFSLTELQSLQVSERFDEDGRPVYAGRYPVRTGNFRIHTLEDELAFVAELNRATGRDTGIYPEIKRPTWHRAEGVDIAPLMLKILERFGYKSRHSKACLQCFDPQELARIRHDLDSDLTLVQLIGDNSWGESGADYDSLRRPTGLRELADTVDGIGPWLAHCFEMHDQAPQSTGLIEAAHAADLFVDAYTVRADSLPDGFATHDELVHYFMEILGVDGLFTDFPDLTRQCAMRGATG